LAGIARHGAARARLHVSEVGINAGRRAFAQIEPEA
jgi:hypothetical protein